MSEDSIIVHDSSHFPHAVRVESKGLNVLILRCLSTTVQNAAGENCRWELEYRWLSEMDPSLSCVLGSDYTYYPTDEIDPDQKLFDQFNLF